MENHDRASDKSDDPDKYTQNILSTYVEIGKQTIPHSNKIQENIARHNKTVPWWSPECTTSKEEKLKLLKIYTKNKTTENYENFKAARNRCNNLINQQKKEHWQKYCTDLNLRERDAWKTYKNMIGCGKSTTKVANLQDKEGHKATTNKDKADLLAAQYEFISSDENLDRDFRTKKQEHKKTHNNLFNKKLNDNKYINKKITLREYKKALKLKKKTPRQASTVFHT